MPRAPDPYVLTVAEVNVDGSVHLTSHLPVEVTLQRGQELHVNVRYQLKETTLQKEAYRFRLSSRIGEQNPPDREETWHDRPVLHDELRGFVGHRYRFDAAGTYQGEATVLAQYLTGQWGSASQTVHDEGSGSGTIRVKVV